MRLNANCSVVPPFCKPLPCSTRISNKGLMQLASPSYGWFTRLHQKSCAQIWSATESAGPTANAELGTRHTGIWMCAFPDRSRKNTWPRLNQRPYARWKQNAFCTEKASPTGELHLFRALLITARLQVELHGRTKKLCDPLRNCIAAQNLF